MKRYLLQLSHTTWRDLTLYLDDLNSRRKKLQLPYIHRSTLIRLAIIHICSLSPQDLDDLLTSDTDSNDQATN